MGLPHTADIVNLAHTNLIIFAASGKLFIQEVIAMAKFVSVKELAESWGISERTVRNYCAEGKIDGAIRIGKSWAIPDDARRPERSSGESLPNDLLGRLRAEQAASIRGGIYHKIQIDLTYNSNHIEGSRLTHDQTRLIFETRTITTDGTSVPVDDIIETANHFRCIDTIIDNANRPVTEGLIKRLHLILKSGTLDSRKGWFAVGAYKRYPNTVGNVHTSSPDAVERDMKELVARYAAIGTPSFDDLLAFHHDFETIHPFQDGNGRVGRLILFKECLRAGIVPFIISDDIKHFYYRGLREWEHERGYLRDTCLLAQDNFKSMLDYFGIETVRPADKPKLDPSRRERKMEEPDRSGTIKGAAIAAKRLAQPEALANEGGFDINCPDTGRRGPRR